MASAKAKVVALKKAAPAPTRRMSVEHKAALAAGRGVLGGKVAIGGGLAKLARLAASILPSRTMDDAASEMATLYREILGAS